MQRYKLFRDLEKRFLILITIYLNFLFYTFLIKPVQ
jgi:hypothetical protein